MRDRFSRTALPAWSASLPGQGGFGAYCAQQNVKLKKYRRGLPPGPEAEAVDELIRCLEDRSV